MNMKKRVPGVITVYLALILMLILALITSMLEHARLLTARNYCNRITQTAQESILSDYYLPLFEHYHVFGLHMTEQTYAQKNEELSEKLLHIIQASEEPIQEDLFLNLLYRKPGFLICDPKIKLSSCANISLLTQKDNFKSQAVSYQKYGITKKVVEQITNQSSSLTQVSKIAKLAEKRVETEQELAVIDQYVLSLIQEIEGLKVKTGGIEQTWFLHKIKTNSSFVKQCTMSEPTQSGMDINHEAVFQALKPKYINFSVTFDEACERADEIFSLLEIIEEEKHEAEKKGEVYEGSMEAFLNDYSFIPVKYQIENILVRVNNACRVIQNIEKQRELAKGKVDSYKQKIEQAEDLLDGRLLSELKAEYPQMGAYTDAECQSFGMIADLGKMKESLMIDKKVLENVLSTCPDYVPLELSDKDEFYKNMEYCKQQLYSYTYEGLVFDYSGIQLERKENTILSKAQKFVNEFGASFVLPEKKQLSQAKLTGIDLISEEATEECFLEQINFESGVKNFFERSLVTEEFEFGEKLYDGIAFFEYLKDHTTMYESDQYQRGQVLMYEREYLLYGRDSDLENIQSIAMKLIGTRTGINYLAALTNPSMKVKAEEFALLTAGFTQLPFLVTFVKHMTLLIWAFEEALIETAALFMGKRIPAIKNGIKFSIIFEELAFISKDKIQQKAKNLVSYNGGPSIGYEGYLNIFLWLKNEKIKETRMMDLIQENLRNEYEDNFRMKNCVTGFSSNTESYLKQKFLFLPYFKKQKKSYDGYQIVSHQRITY